MYFSFGISYPSSSNPFCLLIHSSWLLVLSLSILFMILSVFNLYLWKNIHFSWSNCIIFLLIYLLFIISFHYWFRDLLRELFKKYEILLFVLFFVFFVFVFSELLLFVSFFWASFHALSLGGAFVSLEISLQFIILSSLSSFILAVAFISLQIKEFRIMGLSINDSVYSSLFFFLTGLHFFH